MKKFLLFALAAAMVCTAGAQSFNSSRGGKQVSVAQTPAMAQVKKVAPVQAAPMQYSKAVTTPLDLGNKLTLNKNVKQFTKVTAASSIAAPLKAAALQESYTGMGTNYESKATETWKMYPSVYKEEDGTSTPVLVDLIPSIFEDGSVGVAYTEVDGEIVVEPTVVGTGTDKEGNTFYIMLFSAVDEEGCIRLSVSEDGRITTGASETLLFGAWEQPEYKFDDEEEELVGYLGYYAMYSKVKYLLADEIPAPSALYEPAATYLHVGTSISGYGYLSNLAVMPPFVTFPFKNLTSDLADGWAWSMDQLSYNRDTEEYEVANTQTADTRDFTVNTESAVYRPVQLVASYSGKSGEPFSWGLPATYPDDYPGEVFDPYVYGGQITDEMEFTDGTLATLTCANTSDFGSYYSGSFLTPGRTDRDYTLSTLVSYQGKPAAPLYITGVLFGVYQLEVTDEFNLKCKIQKVSFDEEGHLVLGDVLAESEITRDDLGEVSEYGSYLEWTDFYVEDEYGTTESIEYLFVEDEFAIVIEGWDNGTFECYSLIDGCEFGARANTYFFITGEEKDYPYYFTGNYQHLNLGIYGGWGYLHTEDNTDLSFGAEGGSATIHVDPMYYRLDDDENPTYSLYIEKITVDGEAVEEVPEWITIEVANEDYTKDENGSFVKGIDYDLVVTAAALPADVESRTAEVVFAQTGAMLKVKIAQGDNQGISTVVTTKPLKNMHTFNLAGQRTDSQKGIIVKNGRKFIQK